MNRAVKAIGAVIGCTVAGGVSGFLLCLLGYLLFARDSEALGTGFIMMLATAATTFVGLVFGVVIANDIVFTRQKRP
jgi:hypothetical protein